MLKGIVKGNNLLNENIFSDADSTHINYMKSDPVTLSAGVTYTFSCNASCNGLYIRDVSNDDNIASGNNVSSVSYTPDSDIQVYFRIWNSGGVTGLQPMVNTGSTPLPYEPYQTIHDITRIPMRSKQLWDGETVKSYIGGSSPSFTYKTGSGTSVILRCTPETTYTITRPTESSNRFSIGTSEQYPENNHELTVILRNNTNYTSYTFTTDSSASYIIVYLNSNNNIDLTGLMVHAGDQPIPYVPYGMVEGWEVRDQQGRIIWGADKTLTGTDSITYKGYGLDIKEYDIDGNMVQAAEKAYSVTGTSPLDFQSNGSNATISISGNETQASNQAYTTSGTSPLSFNADGTNLTALSMDGNMNQASSQPYTISGTSPISFMNNGTAIDYTVSGNMNQSGTPTPTSPITPQECGEKTANLWDEDYTPVSTALKYVPIYVGNGDFTLSTTCPKASGDKYPCLFFFAGIASSGAATGANDVRLGLSRTVTAVDGYVTVAFRSYDDVKPSDYQTMLNSGSTALSYEPYGYKVPLTIDGNTQNIYIKEPLRKIGDYSDIVNSDGSVTRVIKKLVLTGAESEWSNVGGQAPFLLTVSGYSEISKAVPYYTSSHFKPIAYDDPWGTDDNFIVTYQTGFRFKYSTLGTDLNDFKTWLSTQYDNNNPVEVWYVLQTPQTDTATTPTITPTSGNNTLSVDTTLTPSNITITSNSSVFPGNPITPVECGVKTENLFDNDTLYSDFKTANGFSGVASQINNVINKCFTTSDIGKTFTATCNISNVSDVTNVRVRANVDGTSVAGTFVNDSGTSEVTFTVATVNDYVSLTYSSGGNGTYDFEGIMLVEGSEPAEYEPYGKYKIPITVGSTTKNIFINQPIRKIGNYSDSIGSDGVVTRNIRKLVLTGQETMTYAAIITDTDAWQFPNDTGDYYRTNFVVSHMPVNTSSTSTESHGYIGQRLTLCFDKQLGLNTNSAIETYLANQYSAGTPVEIWYVLSTPDTTETTTIPTISTVNGSNTLTTQTAITPSNITISTSSSVYPKNPIYPEECGDKTGNLFDISGVGSTVYVKDNGDGVPSAGTLVDGVFTSSMGLYAQGLYINKIIHLPSGTYTLSFEAKETIRNDMRVRVRTGSTNIFDETVYGLTTAYQSYSFTFTLESDSDIKLLIQSLGNAQQYTGLDLQYRNIMINSGQTAATYEPFGYKIPITIGSTTSYIYTKEPIRKIGNYADVVNSDGSITRWITKLVLTGQETCTEYAYLNTNGVRFTNILDAIYVRQIGLCTILPVETSSATTHCVWIGSGGGGNTTMYFVSVLDDMGMSTANDFKAYLAQEYASGHPVEVWYPLQTPTTEQTTIPTLTTVDGKNTATIGTTLAPSSITINATSKVYPNNPIIPEECGDLTENLVRVASDNYIAYSSYTNFTVSNGEIRSSGNTLVGFLVKVNNSSDYTVSMRMSSGQMRIREYSAKPTSWEDSSYIIQSVSDSSGAVYKSAAFTTQPETEWVLVCWYTTSNDAVCYETMLNTGSTAKPYEPYGKYKVPVINNGVTKNIYLNQPIRKIGNYADIIRSDGTVERNIKQMVLTGSNPWNKLWDSMEIILDDAIGTAGITTIMSSHYTGKNTVTAAQGRPSTYGDNCIFLRASSPTQMLIYDTVNGTDRASFNAYIAAQYAAGTPITIWYVLATPETETITTPTLSTIEGTNTLEVDTTLSPSKIDITGHIKYTS